MAVVAGFQVQTQKYIYTGQHPSLLEFLVCFASETLNERTMNPDPNAVSPMQALLVKLRKRRLEFRKVQALAEAREAKLFPGLDALYRRVMAEP